VIQLLTVWLYGYLNISEALATPKETYSGKMADIWQLGVTLYALVYGRVPFFDENIMKVYEKIRFDELKFPVQPEVSPLLKNLIEKMLQKNPEQRITLPQIKVREASCIADLKLLLGFVFRNIHDNYLITRYTTGLLRTQSLFYLAKRRIV